MKEFASSSTTIHEKAITVDHSDGSMKATEEGQPLIDSFWEEIKSRPVLENSKNGTSTMLRAPNWLRSSRDNLFEPSLAYLGPYHWTEVSDDDVKLMLQQKRLCVDAFFTEKSELAKCLMKLKELEDRARSCYAKEEGIQNMPGDKFVKMMLLDCCFIIAVLVCFARLNPSDDVTAAFSETGIPKLRSELFEDLLLVENQVPFFVLQAVLSFCHEKYKNYLMTSWFGFIVTQLTKSENENGIVREFQNLLHIWYCQFMQYSPSEKVRNSLLSCLFDCLDRITNKKGTSFEQHFPVQSVSKLQESGVKFEGINKFQEIRFTRNGTLKIPCVKLDVPGSVNILAFEQTNFDRNLVTEAGEDNTNLVVSSTPLSNTVHFVASMITTAKDLEILENGGVVNRGRQSSREDAVKFFCQLKTKLQLSDDYNDLNEVWKKIDEFIKSRRHRWWIDLKKNYCSDPWKVTGLLVGGAILILTFLQTYYTMYDHYHKQ